MRWCLTDFSLVALLYQYFLPDSKVYTFQGEIGGGAALVVLSLLASAVDILVGPLAVAGAFATVSLLADEADVLKGSLPAASPFTFVVGSFAMDLAGKLGSVHLQIFGSVLFQHHAIKWSHRKWSEVSEMLGFARCQTLQYLLRHSALWSVHLRLFSCCLVIPISLACTALVTDFKVKTFYFIPPVISTV